MTVRRKVFLVLMILWMALIFFYSSRQAEVSAEDSGRIGIAFGRMFIPDFEEWTEEEQQEFAGRIDHPIRKAAHAAEYAILGFLAAGVCAGASKDAGEQRASGVRKGKDHGRRTEKNVGISFPGEVLLPWLIAALYAASDEIHQLFVPGRSGQVSDVILDSTGALAGVAVFTVVCLLIKHRFFRRKN